MTERNLLNSFSALLTKYLYGVAAFVFLVAISFTYGYFWADAADYVDSVTAFQNGKDYNFVDFGHLLWRPLGWLVWSTFFDLSDPSIWRYQIFQIFQGFSYAAGFGSTLLVAYILRVLKVHDWVNILTVATFICSHAFLNFSQTGTTYITALFFLLLGIALVVNPSSSRPNVFAGLAGVSFALSTGFWIAFVWAIPAAMLAAPILFGFNRKNLTRSALTLSAFVIAVLVIFGGAIVVLKIDSIQGIIAWISVASHGNATHGLARVIFGISRSFVFMGDGGAEIKQFLLSNSNTQNAIYALFNATIFKFLAFYLVGLLVSIVLLGSEHGRRFFLFLIASCLPLAIFAISFDGAAIERYLPLVPAVFIAFALSLHIARHRLVMGFLVLSAVLLILSNTISIVRWEQLALDPSHVERASLAKPLFARNAVVFLVNWNEPLVNFNRSFPFHELNNYGNARYNVLVTPGLDQTRTWREEFATRVITAWEKDREVWVSTRALETVPAPEWKWVEGGDANVGWIDFPTFFDGLDLGEGVRNVDGFFKLPRTERNDFVLSQFASTFDKAL